MRFFNEFSLLPFEKFVTRKALKSGAVLPKPDLTENTAMRIVKYGCFVYVLRGENRPLSESVVLVCIAKVKLLRIYETGYGEISEDMTENGYIWDDFNNRILLQTNGCPGDQPCGGTIIRYYVNKQDNYDICHNIFQVAMTYAPHLSSFTYYHYDEEGNISYLPNYRGDKHCTSNEKCIRDITMNDIYDVCHDCPQKNSCTFAFLWTFD